MKTLYIVYSENRSGGERSNPEDPYSTRSRTYIDVKFKHLLRRQVPGKMFYHSVEVMDKVFKSQVGFLAVVRYSDGDSFGTSTGNWHVLGCTSSYASADKLIQASLKDPKSCKPWEGHFNSLEETEVIAVPIS